MRTDALSSCWVFIIIIWIVSCIYTIYLDDVHLYSPLTSTQNLPLHLPLHIRTFFYYLFIPDTPSPVPTSHIIRSVRTSPGEWVICEWSWSQRKVTAHHPSTVYWQYLLNRGGVLVVSPQSMWHFNWTDLAKDLAQVATVVSSCVGQLSHVQRLSLPLWLLHSFWPFWTFQCII